jgi:hypothetical protein
VTGEDDIARFDSWQYSSICRALSKVFCIKYIRCKDYLFLCSVRVFHLRYYVYLSKVFYKLLHHLIVLSQGFCRILKIFREMSLLYLKFSNMVANEISQGELFCNRHLVCYVKPYVTVHCKPSPFGKQFWMANTAIFQNDQKKIFIQSKCEFLKFLFVLLDKIRITLFICLVNFCI